MTEQQVGEALAKAISSLRDMSKEWMEAGQKHDNPEFLWIGKGMHYSVDHIKKVMREELDL